MPNESQEYENFLEGLLKNAENLKSSGVILLEKMVDEGSNDDNQFLAAHAQHLTYLALEELGKFFILLNQYPTPISVLNLKDLGWLDHDTKITVLIQEVRSQQFKSGKLPVVSSNDIAEKLRKFKEPNVYVDYKDGRISKPHPNTGGRSLKHIPSIVSSALGMAEAHLKRFGRDPSRYTN